MFSKKKIDSVMELANGPSESKIFIDMEIGIISVYILKIH